MCTEILSLPEKLVLITQGKEDPCSIQTGKITDENGG